MKQKKPKYRAPNVGETVHCWMTGSNYIAHKHMLFLGVDKQAKDKLLVPSKQKGFEIINLSDLPKDSFRAIGRYNLTKEVVTKKTKKVTGFTYSFHDKGEDIYIAVKLFRGNWKIITKFEMPSWVKVEK
jgi:hypothetical protein